MTGPTQPEASRTSQSGSLQGEVRAPGTPTRAFIGWIGLLSALEGAIERLVAASTEKGDRGRQLTVAVDLEVDSAPEASATSAKPATKVDERWTT